MLTHLFMVLFSWLQDAYMVLKHMYKSLEKWDLFPAMQICSNRLEWIKVNFWPVFLLDPPYLVYNL